MKLKNKVAIITGSSRGIGRATAELFIKEGAKVVINYVKSEKEALELVSKFGEENAIAIKADVSKEFEAKHLVAQTLQKFGHIDILVNNAGEILRPGDWNCDLATWRRTLEIDLTSVWLMIKECAPHMMQNGGSIVNISSYVAQLGSQFVLPYASSKGGVDVLTISMAKGLATKVRVNAIAPGNINTDMSKGTDPEFLAKVISNTPLGRFGEPEEIAKAVLFLASDDSSFVTGHILNVDGGYTLK
jgi:NAD(P)-dependent dehydrogenase (short-subunit alcohol dehydrogenase family)